MSGYIMNLREVLGAQPLIMAAAAVIVVNSDGSILLQHRSDNDCWGLPGGSMELGESFEETARRELREETGLVAGELEMLYVHSGQDAFYRYPNGHEVYVAAVVYTTTEFYGDVKIDQGESLAVEWFHLENIPPNINPLDQPVIELFVQNAKSV